MARKSDVLAWLRQGPSLEELQAAYPDDWDGVRGDVTNLVSRGDVDQLKAYVAAVSRPEDTREDRRRGPRSDEERIRAEVRRHMMAAAIKRVCFSVSTGVSEGRVRFNLVNGSVAQKLLFARDLERKPVSMAWFRLLWPLLWQRRFLMPLVGPKGIYCFYSAELIDALAEMIGDRQCLEIAAGDGTLSRFLADRGVQITATDDYSWNHAVQYPPAVLRQDAKTALRRHQPQVVVCSWPPAGNPFERFVFTTRSVQLYVVISTRHEFGAGNWQAYRQQTEFDFAEDERLSRLVLPPETDPAVYVFRRKSRH